MAAPEDLLPRQLRTVQIVAGALLLGVAALTAVALVVVWTRTGGPIVAPPADGSLPFMTLVAVFLLATQGLLAAFFPGVLTRATVTRLAAAAPAPDDAAHLLHIRYPSLLIALALLEGAALFGGVAFLLEGHMLALAVVVGAVLLMLLRFPTEVRIRAWLTRELGRLAERRLGKAPPGV
jgi:hypothetical protein